MAHLTKVKTTTGDWKQIDTDLFAVGIFEDHSLTEIGKSVDAALNNQITLAIEQGGINGKDSELTTFFGKNLHVIVIGLGKSEKFDVETTRKAGGSVAKYAIKKKLPRLAMEMFGGNASVEFSKALTEGVILGSYQFLDYKTTEKEVCVLKSAQVLNATNSGVKRGIITGNAVCFARDLENHPGNISTPTRLAQAAGDICKIGDMKLTVFDREQFTKMGMGALAGVAQGSDEAPKFIVMEYFGGKADAKPVVLVGKGLTFDSGGISIKPSDRMDEMKYDMCGSGVVLGVMKALAEFKPKMNVIGIIPSTENLGGGRALKPGDILKAYNGKTIEVLNTDAEGRLILADGLSYACKHYSPEFILDFATLTGAVVIALGHIATGIMGTDEALIDRVKAASRATGEKVWEFPLWEEYCKQIKSDIADVKNIGAPRQAGSIAGGAFLKEFVNEDVPWVHFDIAGTAWGGDEKPYTPKKGATGETIRLVLELLGQ